MRKKTNRIKEKKNVKIDNFGVLDIVNNIPVEFDLKIELPTIKYWIKETMNDLVLKLIKQLKATWYQWTSKTPDRYYHFDFSIKENWKKKQNKWREHEYTF